MALTDAVGYTGYARPVAKVLVSLPDDLLERIDARARSRHESRSGYLRHLAERDLPSEEKRRAEVKRLMGLIRADFTEEELSGGAPPVDAAQLIREDRESR
ncbi:MAG: type II toxin-antitoxin system HicB family antitoxin [Solirubrobacterales bacterium]